MVWSRLVLSSWEPVFSTQAEVGATLTGLLFLALSINLKEILRYDGLTGRAGEALILLLTPVFVGIVGVLPQRSYRSLGAELLGIGIAGWAAVSIILARADTTRKLSPGSERTRRAIRAVMAEVAGLPGIAGGAILLTGHEGGLWLQVVGTLLCVLVGITDVWVLLVEIHR